MGNKRKPISKKTRFEVFKRDSFTCQYCGRMAPDVVLEVDHIKPVAEGGTNSIVNLVTSCRDCNRGKGKTLLSVNDTVKKSQAQLKELNERREQLEMMMQWKTELEHLKDEEIDNINDLLSSGINSSLSSHGRKMVASLIERYGFFEVYTSTEISISQYFDESRPEKSASKVVDYISRICWTRAYQKEHPEDIEINKIVAMACRKFMYVDKPLMRRVLRSVWSDGYYEDMKALISWCKSFSEFKRELADYLHLEEGYLWQ